MRVREHPIWRSQERPLDKVMPELSPKRLEAVILKKEKKGGGEGEEVR